MIPLCQLHAQVFKSSLVPRLPHTETQIRKKSLILISLLMWSWRNQKGPEFSEQRGNVLHTVHPAIHSTLSVCRIFPPRQLYMEVSHPLPLLFLLFWVFRYAHAQLRSFYLLSLFDAAHVQKNTSLSLPAQLQCSGSGVPGNKGTSNQLFCSLIPVPKFSYMPSSLI